MCILSIDFNCKQEYDVWIMRYTTLKSELQQIDPVDFSNAVARVLAKQNVMSESEAMVESFFREYPNLEAGAEVITVFGERADLTAREQSLVRTGFLAGFVGLKEMIDTTELNATFE
jgi:hypothetical protein